MSYKKLLLALGLIFAVSFSAKTANAVPSDTIVGWGSQLFGEDLSTGFAQIATGREHSLALKSNGSIAGWGTNEDGRLDLPSPNTDFVAVSAGFQHSVALKEDGSVLAWGANFQGQCNVPVPNADFVAISAGSFHNLALKADGSIAGWGTDAYNESTAPSPNTGFIAVSAGRFFSLALKADGSIVAWGNNTYGQCNVPAPNSGFVAISAGYAHALGLKSDGSIVAWGAGKAGQTGYPNFGQSIPPSPNTGFIAIAAGEVFSMGLKADGSIVTWGRNDYHQCDVPSPNSGFVAISGSFSHGLGLKADGSVVAWGRNSASQCNIPAPNSGFTRVSVGGGHTLALRESGSITAWGADDYNQTSVPAPNSQYVEVAAGGYHSLGRRSDGSIVAWGRNDVNQCNAPSDLGFLAIAAGEEHSLAIRADGSVAAWGLNTSGQCNPPSPNTGFIAVAGGGKHSLGLRANGQIAAWGDNSQGQCSVPVPNSGFVAISAGYLHSIGLKSDGSVVTWGSNDFGQCNVPQPNSGFTAISAGGFHNLALRADGTIVAWGRNDYGQCNIPYPNARFTQIAAGNWLSAAIRPYTPASCVRTINVTADPSTVPVNVPAQVSVQVKDGGGQAAESQRVDVSVERGLLTSIAPGGVLTGSTTGYGFTDASGHLTVAARSDVAGALRVTAATQACDITYQQSASITIAASSGAMSVEDSIPLALDRDMPFGQLLPGQTRTEHITIHNTDSLHSLTVSGLFLKGRPSGTITGNIKDTSGKNMSGVAVSTVSGSYATSTDPYGNYTLFNVSVGIYDLRISSPGYETQARDGVAVNKDQTATENFVIVPVMSEGVPGGVNLALQAVQWPTDSSFSVDYTGSKARDGVVSVTSKWCSTNVLPTHWLAYDLGAVRGVQGFVVRHAGAAGEPTTYNTKQFSFQTATSINGPWTDDAIVDNSAQANVTTRIYNQPRNLRFVRLYITNCGIDNYARIPEFEVWGSAAQAGADDSDGSATTGGAPAYSPPAGPPSVAEMMEQPHDPSTLLVGFEPSERSTQQLSIHNALGTNRLLSYHRIPVDVVKIPKGADMQKVIDTYRSMPGVSFVEPNYQVKALVTPNDPSFDQQWALQNIGQSGGTTGADIRAVDAWDTTIGNPSVVVGVVDTGIQYTHPDLAANIWVNPNPTFGDIHGARWTNGDGTVTSGDPMDDNGHGTHVAGIIGAVSNNAVGVAGVNWNVRLMALKFLNSSGTGSTADALAALQYALDHGVKITNNSWGGSSYSQALTNMMMSAANAGQLVVAAAGNDGKNTDITPQYPSAINSDNIISVASSDNKDQRSIFQNGSSNWGPTTVDLCAPGSGILSTFKLSSYATASGTSMATPFVTGTASLIMSMNPWASYHDIKNWIMQSADPVPAWAGLTVTGGRLNAAAAVRMSYPHFHLSGVPALPYTIPAGGSLSVDVTYAPLSLGSHANTVRIQTDAAAEPTADVELSGSCVSAITPSAIGDIKFVPDDSMVALSGKIVSAAWPGLFYVSADDRSSGIRVEAPGHTLTPGQRANVAGWIRTNADGERFIEATSATSSGAGSVDPLGMKNSALGGEDQLQPETGVGQRGVAGGIGLNNIGLLITTWGEVVQIVDDGLYVDDGSVAGGVRVVCNPAGYEPGDYLSVTGIASCFKLPSGDIARKVLTQGPGSLTKLNLTEPPEFMEAGNLKPALPLAGATGLQP